MSLWNIGEPIRYPDYDQIPESSAHLLFQALDCPAVRRSDDTPSQGLPSKKHRWNTTNLRHTTYNVRSYSLPTKPLLSVPPCTFLSLESCRRLRPNATALTAHRPRFLQRKTISCRKVHQGGKPISTTTRTVGRICEQSQLYTQRTSQADE